MDRQRDFEDTLMAGISEAQREHIWQEAAKVVMSPTALHMRVKDVPVSI